MNSLSDDILLLVLYRLDNQTLSKLSRVPIVWEQVARTIESQEQLFWFYRVALRSPISLTFDQSCWKTTWHVVDLCSVPVQTTIGPMSGFLAVNYLTLNAIKILDAMKVTLHSGNNRALALACRSNDVESTAYLLSDPEVLQTEAYQTSDCLRQAIEAGSYDVVTYLLDNFRQRDNCALDAAMRSDAIHIVRLILSRRPELEAWLRHWSDYCLLEAKRYECKLVVNFLKNEF